MFKQALILGLVAAGLVTSSASMAAPYQGGNRIDTLQRQQARLIQYGIDTGALTASEARLLRAEQNAIRDTEARFRYNGLNSSEIRTLHWMLAQAGQHIRNEINDRERARNFRQDRDHWRDQRQDRDDWRQQSQVQWHSNTQQNGDDGRNQRQQRYEQQSPYHSPVQQH